MDKMEGNKRRKITTAELPMDEGPIVWRILGYAIKTKEDYARLSYVSKKWNSVIRRLKPPVAWKISSLLKNPNYEVLDNEKLVVDLVNEVLEELTDTIRLNNQEDVYATKSLVTPKSINAETIGIFNDFLTCVCSRGNKNAKEIHNTVCEHFDRLAESGVESLCKVLQSIHSRSSDDTVEHATWKLMREWIFWSWHREFFSVICNYVDRSRFVAEEGLPDLKSCADVYLIVAVRERCSFFEGKNNISYSNNAMLSSLKLILKHVMSGYEKGTRNRDINGKMILDGNYACYAKYVDDAFKSILSLISIECSKEEQSAMSEITTLLNEACVTLEVLLKNWECL